MAQTNIGTNGRPAKVAAGAPRRFQPTLPNVEVPIELRKAAERSTSQAKEAFRRMKIATEAASGFVDETLQTARAHGVAMTLEAVELAKANADAAFDFLKAYIGAKTIADAIEVQTAYARKHVARPSRTARQNRKAK